uniref:hypothetical protein n=1 Tax=Pricia sp. TaxID=2268138 RepID=UPI0035943C92
RAARNRNSGSFLLDVQPINNKMEKQNTMCLKIKLPNCCDILFIELILYLKNRCDLDGHVIG